MTRQYHNYKVYILFSLFFIALSNPSSCCEEEKNPQEPKRVHQVNKRTSNLEDVRNVLEVRAISETYSKEKDSPESLAQTIDVSSTLKSEIYDNYENVSTEFLKPEKRKFLQKEGHILNIDFIKGYLVNNRDNPTTLDITGLSARSRIYLLRGIINFKLRHITNTKKWTKEIQPSTHSNIEPSSDFVDQRPTIFQIGNYAYELQIVYNEIEPGKGDVHGRIYGLINKRVFCQYKSDLKDHNDLSDETIGNIVNKKKSNNSNYIGKPDAYEEILVFLENLNMQFPKLKYELIYQKKMGEPILLGYEDDNSCKPAERLKINRFLNGLNLLFDFEVACKCSQYNVNKGLPIVATLPYASNFLDNIPNLKAYIRNIFMGENNSIAIHIKDIIRFQQNRGVNTSKEIRASLVNLHKDDEHSEEEESEVKKLIRRGKKEEKSKASHSNLSTQDWKIYKDYQAVSSQFLDLKKRKYLAIEAHLILLKFMMDYLSKKKSIIDLTGFSSRCRIYLLTEVTNFKLNFRSADTNKQWTKEIRPPVSYGGEPYEEYVDQFPTTFLIGAYSYIFENAWTESKPGGGRIYGIIEGHDAVKEAKADQYIRIISFLRGFNGSSDISALKFRWRFFIKIKVAEKSLDT